MCMQYVPRFVARVLLTSETASADVDESFVSLVASLQRLDDFVANRRDQLKDESRRRRGRDFQWELDQRDLLRYRGRLYIPDEASVRKEVISTHHDSKLAGHFGVDKTSQLIFRTMY